ncbi:MULTISPECIES: hypothetical protein [unclassified Nocardioides]|uniref:hypothetical protein n=1 Tax=unclassified Nocardioides TaxID=2615069 RepID=UPI0007034D1F|nr:MULTISPECIES: hypothetical protein [unclassified Nocardioides]KRC52786.1 hypothetical protein ASE19_10230 [Nocardioides sp. Root79]KRC72317.1 hypothetical protein ASE20_06765 [Nocardioides sp. Root240]
MTRLFAAAQALQTRLPRPEILLGWLVVAHVVLKLLIYPMVMHAPPVGDESAYLNGGRAMSNLLRDTFSFTSPDSAELERNVVASGWFMPGMPVLTAPVYLLFPDAPIWLVRGYIGLVTLILFMVVLRSVTRRIGPGWACVLAVVPGLIPSYVVFTYGAWGDLCAGLVLVLLLVHLVEMFRGLRRGDAPSLKEGLVLGLLAIAVLYLRSSTAILLAGLGAATLLTAVLLLRGRVRVRALGSAVLAGVVFVLLLAPWSYFASDALGGRVITTTTVPTVMANTFGERSEICFGRCDPDSTQWFRPLRYAREVGRSTDTSEVEVLKVMSDYALRDLSKAHYLDQVVHNLGAYALQPNNFTGYLAPPEGRGLLGRTAETTADTITWLMYAPLILIGALSLLFQVCRSLEARVLDILTKLSLGALLVQPFVHIAGARYWTTAGPVFAIAAFSLLRERQLAAGGAPPPPDGVATATDATIVRWLGRVQVLLSVATGAVVVVLLSAVVL